VDDPALLRECIDRRIAFEHCLTSNLQTRSVASIDAHPFPRLLREGALVTLNTDDPGVSRITLSGEHALAERAFGPLDWTQLWRNAVDASFADEATKRWLRAQ
jgi:adenosine deaminase